MTGRLKTRCIELLQRFVGEFQEVREYIIQWRLYRTDCLRQRKAKVTEEDVAAFMDPNRKISPTLHKPLSSMTNLSN